MDANSSLVDDVLKEKVYKILADIMIASLQKGEMTVEESEQSAEFIFNSVEAIKFRGQLIIFLKTLANHWYVYQPAFLEFTKEDFLARASNELKQLSSQEQTLQSNSEQAGQVLQTDASQALTSDQPVQETSADNTYSVEQTQPDQQDSPQVVGQDSTLPSPIENSAEQVVQSDSPQALQQGFPLRPDAVGTSEGQAVQEGQVDQQVNSNPVDQIQPTPDVQSPAPTEPAIAAVQQELSNVIQNQGMNQAQ